MKRWRKTFKKATSYQKMAFMYSHSPLELLEDILLQWYCFSQQQLSQAGEATQQYQQAILPVAAPCCL